MGPTRKGIAIAAALAALAAIAALTFPSAATAARFAYVTATDSISEFKIGSDGKLQPLGSVPAPEAPRLGIAVRPDGQSAYVATNSGILQFDIGADGRLFRKDPAVVPGSASSSDIVLSRSGNSAYALEDGGRIRQYSVVAPDAKLAPKNPATVHTGGALYRAALHPNGKKLYATDPANNRVLQFAIDSQGRLIGRSEVGAGDDPLGIAVAPDGSNAYVIFRLFNGLGWYQVLKNGNLKARDSFNLDQEGRDITVHPNGKNAYATVGGRIQYWDVAKDGSLRNADEVEAGEEGIGIVVSPDGSAVYAAHHQSNEVSEWRVGQGGDLFPLSSTGWPSTGSGPLGIAIAVQVPTPRSFGCDARDPETIAGTVLRDRLLGTRRADLVLGGDGADRIRGRRGGDCLYGDRGTGPRLAGAASDAGASAAERKVRGPDRIRGGRGADLIEGGPHGDRIFGGRGGDSISGGRGPDVILPGAGADEVECGRGRDLVIRGPSGADIAGDCERIR
jgi:DNA-binding beta-propeller fold protein YncE